MMMTKHIENQILAQLYVNGEPVPFIEGKHFGKGMRNRVLILWMTHDGQRFEGFVSNIERPLPESGEVAEIHFIVPHPKRLRPVRLASLGRS